MNDKDLELVNFYSYSFAHSFSKEYIKNSEPGTYYFKIIKVINGVGNSDNVVPHTLEHV